MSKRKSKTKQKDKSQVTAATVIPNDSWELPYKDVSSEIDWKTLESQFSVKRDDFENKRVSFFDNSSKMLLKPIFDYLTSEACRLIDECIPAEKVIYRSPVVRIRFDKYFPEPVRACIFFEQDGMRKEQFYRFMGMSVIIGTHPRGASTYICAGNNEKLKDWLSSEERKAEMFDVLIQDANYLKEDMEKSPDRED